MDPIIFLPLLGSIIGAIIGARLHKKLNNKKVINRNEKDGSDASGSLFVPASVVDLIETDYH